MPRPVLYDRNRIHALLYHRADSRGVIYLNQAAYSREIGISQFHFNRIVQEFISQQRIIPVGRPKKHRRLQAYIVTDPVRWLQETGDEVGVASVMEMLEELAGVPKRQSRTLNAALAEQLKPHQPPSEPTIDEMVENYLQTGSFTGTPVANELSKADA